ncbi:MAG: hypothetical protein A3J70_06185 [Elusimicrobia bacterium RIFCSPHIGHO2_02_FULL_61_10]|nr:MAG: hypothetical protein A3J70_06185 [Elusimicrobia bacterium RIFCSPHIGHO2_02_FULL_61_10]
MNKALRILIIDDNAIARAMIREMVEPHGYEVAAEAAEIKGALAAYTEHKPDLVTLDLSLIGGNGLSVLQAIRLLDQHAKVIVVSGNSQKKIKDLVIASGAAAFLNKPFTPKELLAVISQLSPA